MRYYPTLKTQSTLKKFSFKSQIKELKKKTNLSHLLHTNTITTPTSLIRKRLKKKTNKFTDLFNF